MQDENATNREAEDRSESGDLHEARAQVQAVSKNRADGEEQSQPIQSYRCANGGAHILAQSQLQQQRSESDRGHYHQSQRAEKGSPGGVDDHEGKSQQQQASRDDGPAACGGRFGIGVGQG